MVNFNWRNHLTLSVRPLEETEKRRREKVLEDLSAAKTNYFYLGAHLYDIWLTETYAVHTYDTCCNLSGANFFDYCNVHFGLDKSQVSRYINIVSEFGDGMRGFKEEYKDYSYSLLTEMLPLTPKERKNVKPDWTVKQVREYKKELACETVATSQQKEKEQVYKIIGGLKASESAKNILKCTFSNYPEINESNVANCLSYFCNILFVGYNFDGYGLSYTDKIKALLGLLCFSQDIACRMGGSMRFVNFMSTYMDLQKFGYISKNVEQLKLEDEH